MSDTSQGDGWWQANDLKWYPPQAVIDQLPPPPPSVTAPAPGPAASSSPSVVGNVPATGIRRVTTPQWVEVGAVVLSVVGLLMSWADAGFLTVSGLDTQDGKIVGVAVLVLAGLLAWRVFRRNAANATLVIIAWLAILGATVAEIVRLTTSHPSSDGISINVNVGSGLYVGAIAGIVGLVGSVGDRHRKAEHASSPSAKQGSVSPDASPPPFTTREANTATRLTLADSSQDSFSPQPVRGLSKGKWIAVIVGVVILVAVQDFVLVRVVNPNGSGSQGSGSVQSLPYRQSGSGDGQTAKFQVEKTSWRFVWSYNCPSDGLGPLDFFRVSLEDGSGREVASSEVDESGTQSGQGESKPFYGTPGTYRLTVSTQDGCQWDFAVRQP